MFVSPPSFPVTRSNSPPIPCPNPGATSQLNPSAMSPSSSSAASHSQAAFTAQRLQGLIFLFMGGACVVAPGALLHLSLTKPPPLDDAATLLIFQCFGAQACLCGLLLLTARMDARAFKAWTMAMLPFLVFDAYFYQNGMLTTFGAVGDCAGNILFIAVSCHGASQAAAAAAAVQKASSTKAS